MPGITTYKNAFAAGQIKNRPNVTSLLKSWRARARICVRYQLERTEKRTLRSLETLQTQRHARIQKQISAIHYRLGLIVQTTPMGLPSVLVYSGTMMQLRQSAFACIARLYLRSTVGKSKAAAALLQQRRRQSVSALEGARYSPLSTFASTQEIANEGTP